jgi:hypothetical protein
MKAPKLRNIIDAMTDKGYTVFTGGEYNVNIVGIRSKSRQANVFDDWMTLFYDEGVDTSFYLFRCTTDPGAFWLHNPSRVEGTAILVPGQYKSVYKVDYHNGKYLALCQRNGDVAVYRDANRDNILDLDPKTIMWGRFGVNIHHASYYGTSTQVDKWSAACQVIANINDFNTFMSIINKSRKIYGNSFTYTLLNEEDLAK